METAHEFFKRVRQAAVNYQRAQQQYEYMARAYEVKTSRLETTPTGKGGVATSLQERYVLAREKAEEAMEEWDQLVSEGVEVASMVTPLLGDNCYEYAILRYYCDAMSWSEVGACLFCDQRTAQRWAQVAFDTIDTVGWAHLKAGTGIATA